MAIAATPQQVVPIQLDSSSPGASTAGSVTIASAPDGSRLFMALTMNNSSQLVTPTSPNTTWTRLTQDTAMGLRFEVWQGIVAGGASGTTITLTGTVNFSTYACKGFVVEWRGASTSAALILTNSSTGTVVQTETVTPVAGAPGVVLAFGRKYGSNALLSGPTNGFTDPNASPVSDPASRLGYKYEASFSGSYGTAWTYSLSGNTISTILVLYESAVATLEFSTQPSNGWIDQNLSPAPVVRALNGGVLNTGFTGNVTLSKETGPGTLAGTLTVAAVAGVATFPAVQVQTLGGLHTLRAAAGGHADQVSGSFKVASGTGTGGGISLREPTMDTRQLAAAGQIIPIDMQNLDGSAAEGLTHSDVTIYFSVDGASPVSVGTLVAVPDKAQYTSKGFVEIDTAQNRGQYYFGAPTLPAAGKRLRIFAKSNIGANTGAEGRLDVALLADDVYAAGSSPAAIGVAVRDTAIAGAAASSVGAAIAAGAGSAATAAGLAGTVGAINTQTAKLNFDGSNRIRSTVDNIDTPMVTAIRDAILNWSPGAGYNVARLLKDQLLLFAGALTGRVTPAAVPAAETRTLGGKTLTVTFNQTTGNYTVASDTDTSL